MEFNEIKSFIEQCVKKNVEKTVIYHKLEEKGLTFEEARDIVNRLYDDIIREYNVKASKKAKVRKIKGVRRNVFRVHADRIINFIQEADKVYYAPLIAILVGFILGKIGVTATFYTVIPAIVAGNVFFASRGNKTFKYQLLAAISVVLSITVAKYMVFYADMQVIAVENSVESLNMFSLFSLETFAKEISLSNVLSLEFLWLLMAMLIGYEFSHRDFEKFVSKIGKRK